MALRLAVPRVELPRGAGHGVRALGLRRPAVVVAPIGKPLVVERPSLQMLLDRGGRGIAGQFPNACRVPPVIIGRERRRVCRGLHPWLRSVSLALQTLAEHLAMAAHAFGLLARAAFGGLLVGAPPLHL